MTSVTSIAFTTSVKSVTWLTYGPEVYDGCKTYSIITPNSAVIRTVGTFEPKCDHLKRLPISQKSPIPILGCPF